MKKEEIAQYYAEEKAAEFVVALKEAYLKGYEQCEADNASVIKIDNVPYVDFELPSGTLWAAPQLSNNWSSYNRKYDMYSFANSCDLYDWKN